LNVFFFAERHVSAITASKLPRLLTRCLPGQKLASAKNRDVPDFIGAPDTIRTCDLCLRRAALALFWSGGYDHSLKPNIEIGFTTTLSGFAGKQAKEFAVSYRQILVTAGAGQAAAVVG
jgi:hypothetical protein